MLWTLVGIALLLVFGPIALGVLWELRWFLFFLLCAAAVGFLVLLNL